MERLKRTSTLELTTGAVRTALLSGEIQSGQRLTEEALAARLGVARATLRTALHTLTREGLIEQQPYRGWTATKLTARDVWELFTLRATMEGLAARLAASTDAHHSGPGLSKLRDDLARACQSGARAAAARADARLHRRIVELSGHSRLLSQYDLISGQIRMVIASTNLLVDDLGTLFEQHEPIFAAIEARDPVAAEAAVQHHINVEGERLHKLMLAAAQFSTDHTK